MALIVDTSPLLVALDAADPDHASCAQLLAGTDEDLVVPAPVLSELDYWCHERLTGDVWLAFMRDVLVGAYHIEHPTTADLERCIELQQTYADLRVGVVDASVLAAAERLSEPKLATLDHRHFSTMRLRHVDALELLPAGSCTSPCHRGATARHLRHPALLLLLQSGMLASLIRTNGWGENYGAACNKGRLSHISP